MEFLILLGLVVLSIPFIGGILGIVALFQSVALRRDIRQHQRRIDDLESELVSLRAEAPLRPRGELRESAAIPREVAAAVAVVADDIVEILDDDATPDVVEMEEVPQVAAAQVPAPSVESEAPSPEGAPEATEQTPRPRARPAPDAPIRPTWRPPSPERIVVYLASALGGGTLLLASLLGLKLAMDVGWLGPVPRVVMGLFVGTTLFAGSMLPRRRGLPWLASALGGAGLGILYGSLGAATSLYDLLPSKIGFALLCGVTAAALVRAVRHNDRFLASLGLVGGLLTPIFVSTGENNAVGLFGYLTVLLAGAAATSRRRSWPDLLALGVVGAGTYYVGWTGTWYVTDQVQWGVLAPVAMSVPVVLASRRDRLDGTAAVAILALVAAPLAAVAWLLPVDPFFRDPITGLMVHQPLGMAPWIAAAGVVLLPLPLWWMERRHAILAGVGAAITGVLTVVFALAWATHSTPPQTPMLVGVLAPLLLALAAARAGHHGTALAVVPAGIALAVTLLAAPSSLATTAAPLLLLAAGLILAVRSKSPVGLPAVLTASTVVAFASIGLVDEQGGIALLAPTLCAYMLLIAVPLFAPRLTSTRPAVGWGVAAAVGPVLFLPLYVCWEDLLGTSFVGALPVLMGGLALLAATVLIRRQKVDRQSTTVALFVMIALAGATLALPLQVESQWLSVGWALEVAALAILTRRLHHPLIRWTAVALAVVVGVRLLANPWVLSYGDAAGWPIVNWTLYTWGIPALAMLAAATFVAPTRRNDALAQMEKVHPLLYVMLSIGLGFALVNAEVSHGFQDSGPLELGGSGLLQGMVRSISWAVFGVAVLIAGLASGSRIIRFTGFGFVLLAAAKVFAFDLWGLEGLARVGSVLALGLSLLVAAFLFERLVLRQAPADTDTDVDPDADAEPDVDLDPESNPDSEGAR